MSGAVAAMESGEKRKFSSPSYIVHKTNHQFLLSEMPQDLGDALREYDVDGDGVVTVAEIAAGAHLLRKQADKTKLLIKVIAGMFLLLILQLAGITGLVFAVVQVTQQTVVTAGSPVMTVKGTTTPVQVSSADFYIDANGTMRMRFPAAPTTGAPTTGGRRRLLQAADAAVSSDAGSNSVARVSSADFAVSSSGLFVVPNAGTVSGMEALVNGDIGNGTDGGLRRRLLQNEGNVKESSFVRENSGNNQPANMLSPVCDWSSPDLFNIARCGPNPAGQYYNCQNMQNTCSQFRYSTKMSVFMLSNGGIAQGTGTFAFYMKPAAMSFSVSRIDYISYARAVPNTVCYMDLYRIYTEADLSSWVDLCLYPPPTTPTTPPVEYGNQWNLGEGSEYCPNCPKGPFLDYSSLVYDNDVFDLPCRRGLYGNVTVIGNPSGKKAAVNACFLSLGFVYDPKYLFDIQFPSFFGTCASPFNCPSPYSAPNFAANPFGRHLLQSVTTTGRSGMGAR